MLEFVRVRSWDVIVVDSPEISVSRYKNDIARQRASRPGLRKYGRFTSSFR